MDRYHVVNLYFETSQKKHTFKIDENMEINKDDRCVVETDRGIEIGQVQEMPRYVEEKDLTLPITDIIRIATKQDIDKFKKLSEKAIKANYIFKNKIKKYNLDMIPINSEYTFDETKLIFYFASRERVDFRDLVKELANIFKLRIELRQIGVRDYARIIGDCGICGKTLCCKTYINKFYSIQIKMARDQGLVINPSKLSGACGRLRCCIMHEADHYEEKSKDFPLIGQKVQTPDGKGVVSSLNTLNDFLFVVVPDKGMIRYELNDIKFSNKEKIELKKKYELEDEKYSNLAKEK